MLLTCQVWSVDEREGWSSPRSLVSVVAMSEHLAMWNAQHPHVSQSALVRAITRAT